MNITARLILPVYLANCRYNNALLSTNRICKITITIALPTYTTYTTHLPVRPIINTLIHVQIDSSREWKFFSPPQQTRATVYRTDLFGNRPSWLLFFFSNFSNRRDSINRGREYLTPTIISVGTILRGQNPERRAIVVQFPPKRLGLFISRKLMRSSIKRQTEILRRAEWDTNCPTSRSPCFSINPWTAARSILPSFFIQPPPFVMTNCRGTIARDANGLIIIHVRLNVISTSFEIHYRARVRCWQCLMYAW